MTAQQAVLQVVILRDGLLVGTEVFVPGAYTVGSSAEAEVKLDDPTVDPLHAVIYFQNGRAAVQDNNSRGGLYVNGHRVRACEVRSQDEILCGPFVLKTRVLAKKPQLQKPAPSPEVAALLGAAPPPAPAAPAPQPIQLRPPPPSAPPQPAAPNARAQQVPASLMATVPGPTARSQAMGPAATAPAPVAAPAGSGTVPSSRRAAALAAAPHLRPVEPIPQPSFGSELPTGSVPVPGDPLEPPAAPAAQSAPAAARKPAAARAPARPKAARVATAAVGGRGAPRLNFELYWGDVRRDARSFGPIPPKKPVIGGPSEDVAVPLWGFNVPEEGFVLAESAGASYRVFIPPGAVVEKQSAGQDAFFPVAPRDLEVDGTRRFLTLSNGMAARVSEGGMSLVAYVAPPPEKFFGNPLKGLPWLVIVLMMLLGSGLGAFLVYGPRPRELPDFTAKNLPPVAVKLIAPEPEKKEKAKEKVAELKARAEAKKKTPAADAPPKTAKKEERAAPSKPAPAESKALKALAKLSAAGPATNDVLAAIDKMGSGPGSKNAKNNFKLSGLVGKAPIANAGLGTFGLGGGGRGGRGTKGLEVLNGKGGGGIGALGATGFGKGGKVGGTVQRARARSVSAQGSIDREAVAKVINSHFQEVRGCYERALLKQPGLAGKAVLEWTISTSGTVTSARTKSSTLRSAEVEGCILRAIKTWRFPPAKGGIVIITYPFLFNSVGY